jgi:signal peptidase II
MNKSIKQFLISHKLFFQGIILALIFALIDLYSKVYFFSVVDNLKIRADYPVIEVTSFFNLVQVWNRGVSFGMMNSLEYGKILIIVLNLIITTILLVWLFRNTHKYLMVAISLVVGGALGNLIDRIQNNAVADFLDFHMLGYHWPAFNAADSFVFIGVAMLLLESFFIKNKNEKKNILLFISRGFIVFLLK